VDDVTRWDVEMEEELIWSWRGVEVELRVSGEFMSMSAIACLNS
jgi:hypothetical protein